MSTTIRKLHDCEWLWMSQVKIVGYRVLTLEISNFMIYENKRFHMMDGFSLDWPEKDNTYWEEQGLVKEENPTIETRLNNFRFIMEQFAISKSALK